MDTPIADYGMAGIFVFMCFQYIVKPIVSFVLEKRKNGNGQKCHGDCSVCKQILDSHQVLDDQKRPVIWGFHIADAIKEMTSEFRTMTGKLDEALKRL